MTNNYKNKTAVAEKAGYKDTKLGWIPEEWEIVKLRELGSLKSGTTPLRAEYQKYFYEGNNLWVKTTDLNNGIITVTEENVTDTALKETSLKLFPKTPKGSQAPATISEPVKSLGLNGLLVGLLGFVPPLTSAPSESPSSSLSGLAGSEL